MMSPVLLRQVFLLSVYNVVPVYEQSYYIIFLFLTIELEFMLELRVYLPCCQCLQVSLEFSWAIALRPQTGPSVYCVVIICWSFD